MHIVEVREEIIVPVSDVVMMELRERMPKETVTDIEALDSVASFGGAGDRWMSTTDEGVAGTIDSWSMTHVGHGAMGEQDGLMLLEDSCLRAG